jgi:hypothetical protein
MLPVSGGGVIPVRKGTGMTELDAWATDWQFEQAAANENGRQSRPLVYIAR